ncbi:MAG: N-acetyltransferase [Actinobacteria bacterium]|nr:N-acetyltransferase [Actinomycetota bacterium]
MEVRAQTDTDRAAVQAVITEAFDDGGRVAGLAQTLRARTDKQASLVAADGALVVGHTHLSISWVDAPTRLVEVLTLSPLAVAPSHQARGIGRRLLAEATRVAADLGSPLLFLEGDPAYYSRHGWLPATPLGFSPPSPRIPAAAFQVVTLPAYEPATMRGALVYNDTFWAYDCVGLRP